MKTLRAATRASNLALAQTRLVIEALEKIHPHLSVEMDRIRTEGDQQSDVPLWKLDGIGFFTSRLEEALLAGRVDFAVHSYKDLPTEMPQGLCVAAVMERLYPEDVMVCRVPAGGLEEVPKKARIGTSSVRRAAQLKHCRPDLEIRPIRGNVETRLSKLQAGEFEGIVLARAGLQRLGIRDWKGFCFDPHQFLPAPAQGAIALQTRCEDVDNIHLLQAVHHKPTGLATTAERRVLARLHPGCHGPVGAYAEIADGDMRLTAFVAEPTGGAYLKEEICGPAENGVAYADAIADRLIDKGAMEILRRNG